MHTDRNKPLLLNSLEVQILATALNDWKESDGLKEEKAALLNALMALEYIDWKDKSEERKGLLGTNK